MKRIQCAKSEAIEKYAAKKVPGLSCAIAIHDTGLKEYVLYDGHGVLYASQSTEAIACHIDIIYLSEKENN